MAQKGKFWNLQNVIFLCGRLEKASSKIKLNELEAYLD